MEGTPEHYLRLCRLAGCSPDAPWTAYPDDHDGRAIWLAEQLALKGYAVSVGECARALDGAQRT